MNRFPPNRIAITALVVLALFVCVGAQHTGNQPETRYTITELGMLGASFNGAPDIDNEALTGRSTQDDDQPAQINFVQGKVAFEFVGQVTNFGPTPAAPLGTSNQYGYLTVVRGIDNVFSGSPHNEATAVLTFFNETTTTESLSNGPLRFVDRNGTTTIYLNSAPRELRERRFFPIRHPSSDFELTPARHSGSGCRHIHRRVRQHHLVDKRVCY